MDKEILSKIAQFIPIAVGEVSSLTHKNQELASQVKEAEETYTKLQDSFEEAIQKIADALYDSDFITDRTAYREFIKKATVDPTQLSKAFVKVCSTRDAGTMGQPTTIKVAAFDDEDPIIRRLGWSGGQQDLLD